MRVVTTSDVLTDEEITMRCPGCCILLAYKSSDVYRRYIIPANRKDRIPPSYEFTCCRCKQTFTLKENQYPWFDQSEGST